MLFLLLSLPVGATVRVVDNTGRTVQLEQPARRILALAPHITENLFSIGAGSRIVGTVSYSDYPAKARRIERIGDSERISLEQALALAPDLVIAWAPGTRPAQLDRLRQFGIPVFESDPHSFAELAANLRLYGRLTGLEPRADRVAAKLERRVANLRAAHRDAAPLRVFYQLWPQPLMTVNHTQLIDEMLRLCGGVNPFAGRPEAVPKLSVESVLAAAPEVILATDEETQSDWMERWLRWPAIPAARHRLFYRLDADLMHRATLRAVDGAEQLCRDLDDARRKLGRAAPSLPPAVKTSGTHDGKGR